MNSYDLGDLVRVTATFTDGITAAALDPAVVKLLVRNPAGNTTTYTYGVGSYITRSGVGVYYAEIDADDDGIWHYRWKSTGTGQAAQEKKIRIRSAQAL